MMSTTNGTSIIWYGERGVVNAIVTHLARLNAADAFLRCIQWANGSTPDWVEHLRSTKIIVELGLAEFGNPDLMLVCESGVDSRPYCVFLEAKVCPHCASAISNSEGMTARGFNSSCNGQLALKYRFAKALGQWNGVQRTIEEPAAIYEAYRRTPSDGGLGDPHRVHVSCRSRRY